MSRTMHVVARTLVMGAALIGVLAAALPAFATFPGRNGRIAYSLDRGDGAQIYSMSPNGSDRRQLTHLDGNALAPDWSPDGRSIVFELDHPNGPTSCSIEIMNADGSNVMDLTGARPGCEGTPSFTPDGRRIVFWAETCEACVEAIRSMDLHGRERRLVVQPHGLFFKRPQVSPDGRTVLFLAEQDLGVVDGIDANVKALFTVRSNGTHLRRVVPFDLDPCACGGDWSPDGRSIEFGDNAGYGGSQVRPTNIATVRPDGSGFRLVTDFQHPDVYAANGSYSPDGRWILFRTSWAGHNTLWKIHPDGTHRTLVAHFQFSPGTRDWGPRPA